MTRTLDIARDDRAPLTARGALDRMAGIDDELLLDDARLLVTELVSNAVRHGAGDNVRLEVTRLDDRRLRCEVIDEGFGFRPVPRAQSNEEAGGWGLHLVETLASSWGVGDGSTRVWFELVGE